LRTLAFYRFGGILADDMGLGKTLQSIAYITAELAETPDLPANTGHPPVLVVAPASLTYNWAHEFARFAPHLNVLVAAGQKEERASMLADMEHADVVITSYPLLRRDLDTYLGRTFHTLILDERME
ncbi:hypothetical protein BZG21_32680, partial [Escherichia coli]|nr:hypothetical protein [Escherichia coli]